MIERSRKIKGPDAGPATDVGRESGADAPLAWEQIEAGRYMPRRIRGSCRGRELG